MAIYYFDFDQDLPGAGTLENPYNDEDFINGGLPDGVWLCRGHLHFVFSLFPYLTGYADVETHSAMRGWEGNFKLTIDAAGSETTEYGGMSLILAVNELSNCIVNCVNATADLPAFLFITTFEESLIFNSCSFNYDQTYTTYNLGISTEPWSNPNLSKIYFNGCSMFNYYNSSFINTIDYANSGFTGYLDVYYTDCICQIFGPLPQRTRDYFFTISGVPVGNPQSSFTSTSTMTVGLGIQTMVVQTGLTINPGQDISGVQNPNINYMGMAGTVVSYDSSTGVLVWNCDSAISVGYVNSNWRGFTATSNCTMHIDHCAIYGLDANYFIDWVARQFWFVHTTNTNNYWSGQGVYLPNYPPNPDYPAEFAAKKFTQYIPSPPSPGNAPYTGYATGLITDATRTNIGALDFYPYINFFDKQPQRDGTAVASTLDPVQLLPKASSDPYFDSTSKFDRIDVVYTNGREKVRVVHKANKGYIKLSSTASPGVWEKTQVRLRDTDGSLLLLDRTSIGTSEDIVID